MIMNGLTNGSNYNDRKKTLATYLESNSPYETHVSTIKVRALANYAKQHNLSPENLPNEVIKKFTI